ncbi:MAG: hypothetical protein KIT84_31865 [Labilithrix sp.]|nr:hypothetical protein [Labilithrix sp.]MCW5815668.1 hypothetical protein [Labilithrix sp.]
MSFEDARRVADTVLYEGLILYPYRASSRKNRFRFQFGVVAPEGFTRAGGAEASSMTVEVPAVGGAELAVRGKVRFLQLRRRSVERWDGARFVDADELDVGAALHLAWDEAIEREVDFALPPGDRARLAFGWEAETTTETVLDGAGAVAGRVVRRTERLRGELSLQSARAGADVWKLHVHVANVTPYDDPSLDRDRALRASLVGAHVLLHVEHGALVSLLEPPEHARAAAESCANERAFPVLVGRPGDRSTVLGSPIILYDWPAIAPESKGDFFDATEMDEMLTLRTMTLTEDEKRQARATDPRAAALVARSDDISADDMNRLHGAIRSLRVAGTSVARGSRVRIRLGAKRRRSDAQDMFVDGRVATVEDVREDFEGNGWIAVIVDEDPAAEMNRWFGRYLWFYTDEIEPLEVAS